MRALCVACTASYTGPCVPPCALQLTRSGWRRHGKSLRELSLCNTSIRSPAIAGAITHLHLARCKGLIGLDLSCPALVQVCRSASLQPPTLFTPWVMCARDQVDVSGTSLSGFDMEKCLSTVTGLRVLRLRGCKNMQGISPAGLARFGQHLEIVDVSRTQVGMWACG